MKKIKSGNNKIKKITIIIFCIYIFILCISWSMTTGFDSAPDEKMKYDLCEYMCKNGKLPHGGEESIRNETYGISYAFTPILSYMFSAVFMRVAMLVTKNSYFIVTAARFVSVLCITAYAAMCILISRKLFQEKYRWIFVVFATLIPQLIYLGSYINNDSLALLSISIIVYSWIIGIESNWNWKSCIIMAIGIGVCALSYYNAYGYILCSIIIYFASNYIKKTNIKDFLKKGLTIALIACAIGGWWFVRNYMLYDGDFLGIKASREYGEKYAVEDYKPSKRSTPAHNNVSLMYMLKDMKWLLTTHDSFIGVFRHMSRKLDRKIYLLYDFIFAIGTLSIIIYGIKKVIDKYKSKKNEEKAYKYNPREKEKILFNVIMFICIIIPIVLSMYYSYFNDFQPQGRYIMPMTIPFMYFVAKGIEKIIEKFINSEKIKNVLIIFITGVWIIMPIVIYFKYITKI